MVIDLQRQKVGFLVIGSRSPHGPVLWVVPDRIDGSNCLIAIDL